MIPFLEKSIYYGKVVLRIFIRVLFIYVMIWNLFLISDTIKLMADIDQKTNTIAEAFSQYNRIIDEKTVLPDFKNLVKSNVFIVNASKDCMGSGTTIKVDGKIYILSAGHLDDPDDVFFVREGKDIRPLKLIKVNHSVDLALFTYVLESEYDDLVPTKITNEQPKVGDKVWAIGNPAGLEDAITSGSLVRKLGIFYLIDAKIYYGSSGGGLFNTKGELMGVNVRMFGIGDYILGGTVNLTIIKDFISGKIASEI